MKRDNSTLKSYFQTGDYPSETQFADLIDSFLNIEEEDAITGITNNGDGTYTFQLLSGATETLDVQSLPDDIPIVNIVGLQALLDDKVDKGGDSMTGDLNLPNLIFNNATTSFLRPETHNNNILFIGGNGQGDKDWSNIHMYTTGVFRVNNNDIWHKGNDNSLFPISATELAGGLDLNNYTTAGFYYQTTNADAASSSNYPVANAGSLTVQKSAGVTQQYYTYNDGSPEFYFRAFYNGSWSSWRKAWTNVNDGSGSGLDADTVDGLQASVFVRNDGGSGTRFSSSYLQFNGDGGSNNDYVAYNDATNGYYFNADTARQNTSANANVHAGEFYAGGAYYYGDNKRMLQFSDGWLRLNPSNDFTSGMYCASSIVRTDNQFQVGPNGDSFYAKSNGDVRVSGAYLRTDHNTGYLEGSYNNVGGNGAQSNPIYVIGSSYVPNKTSLGNMYGIGYSHGSQASFLNATDLGTNPSSWGLYVAADGNARIFLEATSGNGHFKNVVYASNFILSSDRRSKKEIDDIKVDKLPVRWRKFKIKDDKQGHQRYGVVAQELEEHSPEFVRTDEQGNKSVAYIDLLVAKNAELEARLEKMEKLIEKLV